MSEYAGKRSPKRLDNLDNRGTLFESFDDEQDKLVDKNQISYSEAQDVLGIIPDTIEPRNGVHVSLANRYREELHLLDMTSGISMRDGFMRSTDKSEIIERYDEDLPIVVYGAKRNMRINNQVIRALYHADELEHAGFETQEVEDDATMMRMQYRHEYAGPENANKRVKRRRFLRKKLAEFGIHHVA